MPLNPKHICSLGRHLILLHPDLPTIIHAYFSTNSYYVEAANLLLALWNLWFIHNHAHSLYVLLHTVILFASSCVGIL